MKKQIVAIKLDKAVLPSGQSYQTQKLYHFYSLFDVEVNDTVVVYTTNGLRIGKVDDILASSKYAKSYIVDKVDLKSHQDRMSIIERAEELEVKLKAEIEKQCKIEHYKKLAKDDNNVLLSAMAREYLELIS